MHHESESCAERGAGAGWNGVQIPGKKIEPLRPLLDALAQVQEQDFQEAHLIIALKEIEHKPYLQAQYPAWVEKVAYWHVHDVEPTLAYNPLQEIADEIHQLILALSGTGGLKQD